MRHPIRPIYTILCHIFGCIAFLINAPMVDAAVTANDSWRLLGTGVGAANDQLIRSVLSRGSGVYVSGNFTSMDGVAANHVAYWNGSIWSPLGSGLSGDGDDIVSYDGVVYVVGKFAQAGGNAAVNVAAWNGSVWSALDFGVPNYPYAATIHNGSLYVGGGQPAWVKKWTGTTWETIATGSNGWVYNLTSYNGKLIISGDFNDLNGESDNDYLVQLNSSGCDPLGIGVNYVISGTTVGSVITDLYVSGQFTTAGGSAASHIARWNGSNWTALGSGVDAPAHALIYYNNSLYAGGDFNFAGGNAANHVARWDGTNWSAMGDGLSDIPFAGCLTNNGVVFAGQFSSAGGKAAGGIAVYNDDISDPIITISSPVSSGTYMSGKSQVTLRGSATDDGGITSVSYELSGATVASGTATGTTSWSLSTPSLNHGVTTVTITARDVSNRTSAATLDLVYPTTSEVGTGSSSGSCGIGSGVGAILMFAFLSLLRFRQRGPTILKSNVRRYAGIFG